MVVFLLGSVSTALLYCLWNSGEWALLFLECECSRVRRSASPIRVKGANQGSGGAGREREEKVEHPADDIVSSSRY